MINYGLPKTVTVDGKEYRIRNGGDYRVILDIITALNDVELTDREKVIVALTIFFEDEIPNNAVKAWQEVVRFLNMGEDEPHNAVPKPKLMDWEQDFKLYIAPINKALGCEIRSVSYLHWWTFLSGFHEISPESTFAMVVSIRKKKTTGEKLTKYEQRFCSENCDVINIKADLSSEELAFLDGQDGD